MYMIPEPLDRKYFSGLTWLSDLNFGIRNKTRSIGLKITPLFQM